MICPNCEFDFEIKSADSNLFGCPNCHFVFAINPNNILQLLYRSSKFNINYQSSELFKLNNKIEINHRKFDILNRSIWVADYLQYFDDYTNDSNRIHFHKKLNKLEIWQLKDEFDVLFRIEKLEDRLFFCEEIDSLYKNFAYHHWEKSNIFSKTEDQLEISISDFETNEDKLAFQDGILNFHYIEGELDYQIKENLVFRFSNYRKNSTLFQIEDRMDFSEMSSAKTFIKKPLYRLKKDKFSTKNWFSRLFS
jgi:hypothetical protein